MADFRPREHFNRRGEEKMSYATKREAKQYARNHNWGEPRPYRCWYCAGWHLGQAEVDEASIDDVL